MLGRMLVGAGLVAGLLLAIRKQKAKKELSQSIPVIDIAPLLDPSASSSDRKKVATSIGTACREFGFFYVTNHNVPMSMPEDLMTMAREFFSRPLKEKMKISMRNSGLHWKGYFPRFDELTSGKPDNKEGLYFGEERCLDHPAVLARFPMHGPNQWPEPKLEWQKAVTDYMNILTHLGHAILEGVALSLNLPENFFRDRYCVPAPFTPFRIFHYPRDPCPVHGDDGSPRWGVGRHTDYGVLTILYQDKVGGLQVEKRGGSPAQWIAAPPIKNTFIVNIGDMLEIWTNGWYKATPHRVESHSSLDRLSLPFFFDPGFEATIDPNELAPLATAVRNDSEVSLGNFKIKNAAGEVEHSVNAPIRYGTYITHKVAAVFPELFKESGAEDSYATATVV